MIVTADWVLPVSSPPLQDGAVLVTGDAIAEVGARDELVARHPGERVEQFPGCVLMPGLVNAHTHLSLSVLAGLVPPMPMLPFLQTVTRALNVLTARDLAASAGVGALRCLDHGVTCVGDISYGADALHACGRAGVAGVFFFELLGIDAEAVEPTLRAEGFFDAPADGRVRRGVGPHTPYTAGPALLREATAIARSFGAPVAIHVAESSAERELMVFGTGELAPTASRLAYGFTPPWTGSVAYLEELGVLDDALAVHCADLEPGDPERLAARARGVALCPRSNAYLSNGAPDVRALRYAGVHLALGTDSPASNVDTDLLAEARALVALDPTLSAADLLSLVTLGGAHALGLSDRLGSLRPGLQADLALLRTGATADPQGAAIEAGVGIDAVMSAGVWRVRGGVRTTEESQLEHDARAARATAVAALSAEAV